MIQATIGRYTQPDMGHPDRFKVSRRQTLRWAGAALASSPLAGLGCSGTKNNAGHTGAAGSGDDVEWASGGTASMTSIATSADPFQAIDPACALTCTTVLGPCHDDTAPEREDISENQPGLPMRLGLRIIDDQCMPVTDASVDIWHTDVAGLYSSEKSFNPGFCTASDPNALASQWFRGLRMTNAEGIAWFNTCFPGWYPGRANHIHVMIRRPTLAGDVFLTTQIAFPEALNNELFEGHPDYKARGLADTPNAADTLFPFGIDRYVVETRKLDDGVLLAWKTLIIQSTPGDAVCTET